jgi:hypothetical protein
MRVNQQNKQRVPLATAADSLAMSMPIKMKRLAAFMGVFA